MYPGPDCDPEGQKPTEHNNFTGSVNLARYFSKWPTYHNNLAAHHLAWQLAGPIRACMY